MCVYQNLPKLFLKMVTKVMIAITVNSNYGFHITLLFPV